MPEQPESLAMRIRDAAVLLGVPERTAYRWASEGRIPTVRIGRVLLVPRRELEAWLARQVQPGKAS